MAEAVGLVLGGGGARGYAHIGVIRELESRGYIISSVSGTSMGALVGGIWAAGKLEEYCDWVSQLEYFDLVKLLDVSLGDPGFIKGNKLFDIIRNIVGNVSIESLPVPFTAVATNLRSRKEVWFQKGDLVTAIRASSAIPSLFSPVNINGQLMVDGGVLNPLPMAPSRSSFADFILAVDLLGKEMPEEDVLGSNMQEDLEESWLDKIWPANKNDNKSKERKISQSMSIVNILYQSMEVMQESLGRYKIAGHPPDILVSIPKNICRFYDFHKFDRIESIGREFAEKAIDNWESDRIQL